MLSRTETAGQPGPWHSSSAGLTAHSTVLSCKAHSVSPHLAHHQHHEQLTLPTLPPNECPSTHWRRHSSHCDPPFLVQPCATRYCCACHPPLPHPPINTFTLQPCPRMSPTQPDPHVALLTPWQPRCATPSATSCCRAQRSSATTTAPAFSQWPSTWRAPRTSTPTRQQTLGL